VIPAVFGEFLEQLKLRRVCRSCNSQLSKYEQVLAQCGPERFWRDVVVPTTKRSRGNRRSWTGASGFAPPGIEVESPAGRLAGRPSGDPMSPDIADQLVIRTTAGDEYMVVLFPSMTPDAIISAFKKTIAENRIDGLVDVRLNCSPENEAGYLRSLQKVWPDHPFNREEGPGSREDTWTTRISCEVPVKDYCRAIAKIALHYYLATSPTATGHERAFANIRNYVLNGDGESPFRNQGPLFRQDPVEQGWHHVLAAVEKSTGIFAYVSLFQGPVENQHEYHLYLGQRHTRLAYPDNAWAHLYLYHDEPPSRTKVGSVHTLELNKHFRVT